MPTDSLASDYLPPERATPEDLAHEQAIIHRQGMLTAALDASLGFAFVLNRFRQIVHVNETAEALFQQRGLFDPLGLRPGESLDCVNAFESEGGCGTAERCRVCGAGNALAIALTGSKAVRECRIRSKTSGEDFDLLVRCTPMELEGESFILMAAADISHEKRRQVLERIFFHDILNTAGGIQGLAGLMPKSTAAMVQQKFAPMLEIAAKELVDEVSAQRELTLAESGELEPQFQPVDALHVLRLLLALLSHHAVCRLRTLEIANAEPHVLVTDQTLLMRVLVNLIKNGLEAEADGGTVTIGCRRAGDQIEFHIANSAVMPRTVQAQVFQRSFSTKGPGRGVGTYSIRLLTERYLGGRISFSSAEGAGTRFVASFPVGGPVRGPLV